jgi:membrane associated rhomboid family serine protease
MSEEVSSPNMATDNTQFVSREHQWDLPDTLPVKLESAYGYVCGKRGFVSTRDDLIALVRRGQPLSLVWTPDTPEPVYPETVPFLLDALRANQRRTARNAMFWGAGFIAVAIVTALVGQDWRLLYRNFFFPLGALFATEGIWILWCSRSYTQADAMGDRSSDRFREWLKKKKLSVYSLTLLACLVVVIIAQQIAENSVEVTGLVKPAVWNGEIWRLWTATLMHVNFTHFWMNFAGLVFLAKLIEHTMHRAFVPLIFLLTAPIGSIFSVLLYPNTTSIGSSGGIMGLLGFITVAVYFDRTRYPSKYFRRLIEVIVLTGVLGVFGFAFIDNAGHLGGLFGGVLLGWLLLKNERWIKHARAAQEMLLNCAGVAALFLLAFMSGFIVYRLMLAAN